MVDSDGGAQAWHRDVVETAPVPVAVYDAGGRLRYVNEAAVEFVDAEDRESVIGRRAVEFVHPEDREEIGGRVERVLNDREAVPPVEVRFVATTGDTRHAVTAGAPITYEGEPAGQAVLNDITERKRRERQLRRERDRFELLFENLPSAVVYGVMDGEHPTVRRVNRHFEEVFGHGREEIEGEDLDEYIVPDEELTEAERLNRRIRSEGRVQTEVRRETTDGIRDFLLDIVLDDPQEEVPEGYAIYTDITEKKRTERELERQNERLEEFASVVAHDLRNPLNVARGAAELARETGDHEHLQQVVAAHDRMGQIIEDLLALARQGETIDDPEPVDVAAVAEEAWETVQTPGADLRIEESHRVIADRGRLREVLENLFRNAVEHGSTSNRPSADDSVEHGSTGSRPQADDSVEHGGGVTVEIESLDDGFYVADDGPGIPPGEREQAFESGYTTADDGTGLGLTIVDRVADAHGWTVEATESESGGARFEITGVETPG